MQTKIRPAIHAPYTATIMLANLGLFAIVAQAKPVMLQLHAQYAQQLPGLAQLVFDFGVPVAILIAVLLFAQWAAIVGKSPRLYHLSMAGSILTALFLLLALFSATLLPVLRFVSVVQS